MSTDNVLMGRFSAVSKIKKLATIKINSENKTLRAAFGGAALSVEENTTQHVKATTKTWFQVGSVETI